MTKEFSKCTIYEFMKERNKDNLENIALEYFERKITYRELFNSIECTARAFSSLGVKAGDVVVAITINTPETVYMLYALNMIGAIFNMVDPRTSVGRIKEYIYEADARYVVALEPAYPKVERAVKGTKVEKIVVVSPADSLMGVRKVFYQLRNRSVRVSCMCVKWGEFIDRGRQASARFNSYTEDSCCVIVHTGDTSDFSQGVMLSNDKLNATVQKSLESAAVEENQDACLDVLPSLAESEMVLGIHEAISAGWHSVITGKIDHRSLETLLG